MSRTGHYLTPRTGHASPAAVVSVVVAGRPVPTSRTSEHVTTTIFGHAYSCCSRRDHGKWSKPEVRQHDSMAGFWTWLERWAATGRKTHIVAPCASDALNLLGFWERIDRLGARHSASKGGRTYAGGPNGTLPAFAFDSLVTRGSPDIVEYVFNRRTYLWLSGVQFFPVPHHELAKLAGYKREVPETPGAVPGSGTWTQREVCELWHSAYRRLGQWWDGLECGGMGRTIGQCAKHYLLSRTPPKTVATHNDERVLRLERLACHGGRASTWYYGDVIHPDHKPLETDKPPPPLTTWKITDALVSLDVCSMYPFIMATERLPVKLVSYRTDITPTQLLDHLPAMSAIAHVDLETDTPEYPHRVKEFVLYPVGRFSATLCGPELLSALRSGHVCKVHQAALYTSGTPFSAAARALLEMRAEASRSDDRAWEAFVKLLSNSLTGKLAQRTGSWVDRPHTYAEKLWGEWPVATTLGQRSRRFRAVAGMVQEWVDDGLGVGTMQACYAHVTSHGRDAMRRLRGRLGPRACVSQDTDGLWVLRSRLVPDEAGTPYSTSRKAGGVRLDHVSTRTRFLSPKHYYACGDWTTAGLHNPSITALGLAFRDSYTSNILRRSPSSPPISVDTITRDVTLTTIPHDGLIGHDGWQEPTRLPLSPRQLAELLKKAQEPAPSPSLFGGPD